MDITRRLSDGLVQYKTSSPYVLTDRNYKLNGIEILDINNSTHEVIKNVTIPKDFRAGLFTYNNGDWAISDKAMYDKIIATELAEAKTGAILKLERDTDSLIKEIVGERAFEYELAEKEAIAFKAAGYPENDVPASVSSDAIANDYSNTIACDLILTMANSWRAIQSSLRAQRLLSKANTKNALTVEELNTIEASWNDSLILIKQQII